MFNGLSDNKFFLKVKFFFSNNEKAYNDGTESIKSFKHSVVSLTPFQSLITGASAGASSSVINHPFQVLRARFQNYESLKIAQPSIKPPPIFTSNLKVLFKGFSATLLSMWSLTITQSLAKHSVPAHSKTSYTELLAPLFGGFTSAVITTPLEGAILRQSKTITSDKVVNKQSIFENSRHFYRQHGLRALYSGAAAVGVRTSIVGGGFSFWTPAGAKKLEEQGLSNSTSMAISGVAIGTVFAAVSQPAETIRIEQQFVADGKSSLSMHQAAKNLIAQRGMLGLFKGAAYRVPRTAPGIFINAMVYNELEKHFHEQNQNNKMR